MKKIGILSFAMISALALTSCGKRITAEEGMAIMDAIILESESLPEYPLGTSFKLDFEIYTERKGDWGFDNGSINGYFIFDINNYYCKYMKEKIGSYNYGYNENLKYREKEVFEGYKSNNNEFVIDYVKFDNNYIAEDESFTYSLFDIDQYNEYISIIKRCYSDIAVLYDWFIFSALNFINKLESQSIKRHVNLSSKGYGSLLINANVIDQYRDYKLQGEFSDFRLTTINRYSLFKDGSREETSSEQFSFEYGSYNK